MIFDKHSPPKVEIITHTGKRLNIENHVSIQTSKSLASPTATGQISLAGLDIAGRPWDDQLSLYDIVKISWYSQDGKYYQDGIFLISSAVEGLSVGENGIEERLNIEIVGAGHALLMYTPMFHSWLENRSNLQGIPLLQRSNGKNLRGTPGEVIESLFNIYLNDEYEFLFADGRRASQVLRPLVSESLNSFSTVAFANTLGGSSLWETMKEYSDNPWHEMFVDTPWESLSTPTINPNLPVSYQLVPGVKKDIEAVYHRPTPFDPQDWIELYNQDAWGFDLDRSEVIGEMNVAPHSDDVKNFFYVTGHNPISSFNQIGLLRKMTGGKVPRYDVESIRRFGLRMMEYKTLYIDYISEQNLQEKNVLDPITSRKAKTTKNTSAIKYTDMLLRRTEQLHLWFGYPNYFKGVIPLVGRVGPSRNHGCRIGGIINDKEKGRHFYIDGVSQSWSINGKHITSLSVVKGHIPQKRAAWWSKRKNDAFYSGASDKKGIKSS